MTCAHGQGLPPDELVEALAVHVLHDDKERVAFLAAVNHLDDVRVVQLGGDVRLAVEALEHLRRAREPLRQDLDGHGPVERRLHPLIHDRHAALADLFDGLVVAQHRQRPRSGARLRSGSVGAMLFRHIAAPSLWQAHGVTRRVPVHYRQRRVSVKVPARERAEVSEGLTVPTQTAQSARQPGGEFFTMSTSVLLSSRAFLTCVFCTGYAFSQGSFCSFNSVSTARYLPIR